MGKKKRIFDFFYLSDRKKKIEIGLLISMCIIGFAIRIKSCYFGYPYALHPDEPNIVEKTIDMIARRSYEANVYNHPDHFIIKCLSVIFQLASFIKFHVNAETAFDNNPVFFYIAARIFTSVFGALMIPLSYMILEKLKKGSGLIGAAITTVFNIFIEHSAYSTPDIILTFLVMLIAYNSMLYLEKPDKKIFVIICVLTGIGIAVKYTCAICCLWIAFLVIYNFIKQKDFKNIIKYGAMAVLIVFLTFFFIAPNLVTNISTTIYTIRVEARDFHAGADNLGFFGNLFFYFKTFFSNVGFEAVVFFGIGAVYICKELRQKNEKMLVFIISIIFWLFTSYLSLHWERWGMPVYPFWIFAISLGINYFFGTVYEKITGHNKNKIIIIITKVVSTAFTAMIGFNIFINGLSYITYNSNTDTRVNLIKFCESNNITEKNTLFDGYTPLKLRIPSAIDVPLNEEGKIELENKNIRYFIISSMMYKRYYAEPERYKDYVKMYDAIQNQCELITELENDYFDYNSSWSVSNIVQKIRYLLFKDSPKYYGPDIKIFERRFT